MWEHLLVELYTAVVLPLSYDRYFTQKSIGTAPDAIFGGDHHHYIVRDGTATAFQAPTLR